ncbi:MAG: ketopantoate reductase family protein [Thermoplasmata archaeon]|nr:ketopantoate reductase family protein [Thermoplasmata archaeon]
MKFIVYGAGALGSLFAALLSKKHDVLIVGREKHVEAIEKNGLIVEGLSNGIFHPKTRWDGSRYELIILTTKAYDTKKAVEEAVERFGKLPFLSLQNGLNNEEEIASIVGYENVIGGITNHGVTFIDYGKIRHAGYGETVIGEMDGKISNRIRKIAKAFNEAGIETRISKKIKEEIWRKVVINSAINPLTTIFKCKNGAIMKYKSLIREICDEGIRIARKEGYVIDDAFKKTMEIIEKTADNYSSMLQDVMNGKRTEIEEINGAIANAGEKHGIKACYNIVLTKIIKEMENVGT